MTERTYINTLTLTMNNGSRHRYLGKYIGTKNIRHRVPMSEITTPSEINT